MTQDVNPPIFSQKAHSIYNSQGVQVINNFENPINIDPEVMVELIRILFKDKDGFLKTVNECIEDLESKLRKGRTPIDVKNNIHQVTEGYYSTRIKQYAIYFPDIQSIINSDDNVLEMYNYIAEEINQKIEGFAGRYSNFQEVFEDISATYISKIDGFKYKKLIKHLTAYMYFMCDVGKNE